MDQSRLKRDAILKNLQRRIMRSKKNIASNTAPVLNKYKDSLSDIEDDFYDSDSRSTHSNPCLSSELPPTRKTNSTYRLVPAAKSSSPLPPKRDRRPKKVC
jgi:hypothetical protein